MIAEQVPTERKKILGCATQGSGGDDEARLRTLLSRFDAHFVPFDRENKKQSLRACLRLLREGGFDLFVLEGTGLAGGLAAILGRLLYQRRFVLSSGDAVSPFLRASMPLGAPFFAAYERLLYRLCEGFAGWTPYLVGRALTYGARRAVTIPGWPPYDVEPDSMHAQRIAIREKLGIPKDAVVFGIAGNLSWSSRYKYCYGSELVRAARRLDRSPYILIVGDGSGLRHLEAMAGDALNKTILLTGRVPREQVAGYLAAMDVGSLPQSVDGLGSFRFSTKITEYQSVGLPFITNQIPMSYDLDHGNLWRLPGGAPWCETFLLALSELMKSATLNEIAARKSSIRPLELFSRDAQVDRFTAFLDDLIAN